eukprot:3050919-Alexandrium_andersonii.AAC.1
MSPLSSRRPRPIASTDISASQPMDNPTRFDQERLVRPAPARSEGAGPCAGHARASPVRDFLAVCRQQQCPHRQP